MDRALVSLTSTTALALAALLRLEPVRSGRLVLAASQALEAAGAGEGAGVRRAATEAELKADEDEAALGGSAEEDGAARAEDKAAGGEPSAAKGEQEGGQAAAADGAAAVAADGGAADGGAAAAAASAAAEEPLPLPSSALAMVLPQAIPPELLRGLPPRPPRSDSDDDDDDTDPLAAVIGVAGGPELAAKGGAGVAALLARTAPGQPPIMCLCQSTSGAEDTVMICCACGDVYHHRCCGLSAAGARNAKRWACPLCAAATTRQDVGSLEALCSRWAPAPGGGMGLLIQAHTKPE